MRLMCGRLEQCGVRRGCLSTNFGPIKIRLVLPVPSVFFSSNNMSAPAKSNTPTAPSAVESRDWTKATTPELQSGSEDEASVLDAKTKERRRCKQVKKEEKQHREEAERRAREEAEARAREEAERKAREEAERVKAETERKAREQARAESQQRKAAEEAAKQRAVEIAAKQKTMAQEASKKRAREEPEAGPVGEVR